MKITNFYSKSFLKTLFFILTLLGLTNVLIIFTDFIFMAWPIHAAVAGLFFVGALLVLTKEFFVKYDSRDDFIEIERSRLFSNTKRPRKGHIQGYWKYRVCDYDIIDRWYGSKLILNYEKPNGNIDVITIPFSFISQRHVKILKRDLSRILQNDTALFVGSSFKKPFTK
ncbi:hypothetical protein [Salibacter halophilus]|uniref:Uncharacterized protein n=1 Tax=Salibacter halophilus TaxID=1803916 RepID=A0A6N6M9G0_9FLAO|nr:hypothetical protein [Salibacter halophilus]KAB1065726.1 hypothetical protein F3059_03450 [Salibacter halophilus]